jgi:ADP-ribose pyrophosphatase YjhB (NUDIX family)
MDNQSPASVVLTVDIALFRMTSTGLEILLIERGKPPYQGKCALPGGKLNTDDASLEQAILREVREETGLTLPAKHLRQVGAYGNAGRDPRGRYVSVLYTLTEMVPESFLARAGDDAIAVNWFTPHPEHPALAFDHRQMIGDALQFHYNWRRLTFPGTRLLSEPRQCEIGSEFGDRCPLPAHWQVNGWAMCDEDIRTLADMNSDNEELVRPALLAMKQPKSEV